MGIESALKRRKSAAAPARADQARKQATGWDNDHLLVSHLLSCSFGPFTGCSSLQRPVNRASLLACDKSCPSYMHDTIISDTSIGIGV